MNYHGIIIARLSENTSPFFEKTAHFLRFCSLNKERARARMPLVRFYGKKAGGKRGADHTYILSVFALSWGSRRKGIEREKREEKAAVKAS